jgi:hypothetical protein
MNLQKCRTRTRDVRHDAIVSTVIVDARIAEKVGDDLLCVASR